MKKVILVILFLFSFLSPAVFAGSSAINYANIGNLSGYQGTDWKSDLTFTSDNLGASSFTPKYRKVGDTMEIRGYVATGTLVGSPLAINLPTGYEIDCTKVEDFKSSLGGGRSLAGNSAWEASSGWSFIFFPDCATSTSKIYASYRGNSALFTKINGNDTSTGTAAISFEISVPIKNWVSGGAIPGSNGSGLLYSQTATGTATWTVPSNVYAVFIRAAGGGGQGGGYSGGLSGAGGGGGSCREGVIRVVPGASITVTVGVGGTTGTSGTNGQAGTASKLTYNSIDIFTVDGGSGGQPGGTAGAGVGIGTSGVAGASGGAGTSGSSAPTALWGGVTYLDQYNLSGVAITGSAASIGGGFSTSGGGGGGSSCFGTGGKGGGGNGNGGSCANGGVGAGGGGAGGGQGIAGCTGGNGQVDIFALPPQ